jgi:hypothetical protein
MEDEMGTFIVAAVLLIIIGAIITGIVRSKKKGINPICGCSCDECHGGCHTPDLPDKITKA